MIFLAGNANGSFVLSTSVSNGEISLRNHVALDYETTKWYLLKLIATNLDTNKTTTANVTIIITDVNDNPPIFTSR